MNYQNIATCGPLGFVGPLPGTLTSLMSLSLWAPIVWFRLNEIQAALIVGIFVLGWWALRKSLAQLSSQDPREAVIDEVVGQGVALIFCPHSVVAIFLGFVWFRFFDMLKPWPISWFDRNIKGPFGVMLDDVIAGVFAAVVNGVIFWQLT